MIKVIGFDADNTLWHNENIFLRTQNKIKKLLSPYVSEDEVEKKLFEIERGNLNLFGYGVKAFILSIIETAIKTTDNKLPGSIVLEIIELAKEMINSDIILLDGVEDILKELYKDYSLILLSKGDLFDQEHKLEKSGLKKYFYKIEFKSEKNKHVYRTIIEDHNINIETFLMVGNSLESDISPVASIGAKAVYIPYKAAGKTTTEKKLRNLQYYTLDTISKLPTLIRRINS